MIKKQTIGNSALQVKELMMTREAAEVELQEADGDLTMAIKKIVVS